VADPQQYTDAQLSDGNTLRFLGQLGPDEVKQKVQNYRARQAVATIPPTGPQGQIGGIKPPAPDMEPNPDPLGLSRLAGAPAQGPDEYGASGFEHYQAPAISQLAAGAAKSVPGLTGGLTGFEQGEGGLSPEEMKAGMQQATTPQNPTEKTGYGLGTFAQMMPWGALAPRAAAEGIPLAQKLPFLGKFIAPGERLAQAGEQFGQVMDVAKDTPVSLDNAQQGALKLMDWQRKTQLGPTVNKFLNRITSAKQGPLTYGEARDWYTVLGRLSSDEMSKLPPPVMRDLQGMVGSLKQDIGAAAEQAGQGPNYWEAMKQYATGKQGQKGLEALKEVGVNALKYGAGPGLAGYFVKQGIDAANQK